MARSATPEIIKVRRQIIALSAEDFQDLMDQIDIIVELRAEMAKKEESNGNAGKTTGS